MRYFDHNATYPVSAAARAAWLDAVERYPANPSSPHRWGARASHAVEAARAVMAGRLGCGAEALVWTSGATEGNNAVMRHLAEVGDGVVLVSGVEHPSMGEAVRRWLPGRWRGIPVDRAGVVDAGWVEAALRGGGVAGVVVMAANNETGVLQPWGEILAMCRERGVVLVCDAAQWVGRLPCGGLGACDYLIGCAHKFGGVPGVGFMKVPAGFRPLLVGGPQEEGRRAGTENVPGVLAMVAALEAREGALASGAEAVAARLAVREGFEREVRARVPGVEVVGAGGAGRLWNTVSVLMPPADDCRRRWVVKLDRLGFAVSTGSACASGKEKPSHVLAAMGYRAGESDRMLRFSGGWETGEEAWGELVAGLEAAAAELRSGGRERR